MKKAFFHLSVGDPQNVRQSYEKDILTQVHKKGKRKQTAAIIWEESHSDGFATD